MSHVVKSSLLVLGLLTAAPLYVQAAGDEALSTKVRYTELDLAKPAADEKLYQRIKAAARQVCRGFEGRELSQVKPHKDCIDSAVSHAVAQVNHPQFTAYYAAHNLGKSLPTVSALPKEDGIQRISNR